MLSVVGCLRKMVAGRNDDATSDALILLVGSLGQIPQANAGHRAEEDEFYALGKFQRNNPPIFGVSMNLTRLKHG